MLESWFQAGLQLHFMMNLGVNHKLDGWDKTINSSGLAISCVSVLYGLSTYNLRKILRTEPSLMKTLRFTLTELSTTIVIFLHILTVWVIYQTIGFKFSDRYGIFYIKTIPLLILYISVPFFGAYQLSFRLLRLINGYFSQDYRINFSCKCQELYSLPDLVKSRGILVIVNMIYELFTTCAATYSLHSYDLNPLCIITSTYECSFNSEYDYFENVMVLVLAWYTANILSFLQNFTELILILIANKSFLDWAFKDGLEEVARLARLRERERLDELEENNLHVIKMSEL